MKPSDGQENIFRIHLDLGRLCESDPSVLN